eukprot:CAMPEP_0185739346 /NCGR_PEP_ID=MMETSP1171-20130828/35233_1 /TAXON_ID=374046 /ORGANISM="Helicotheca tamensis, Strain CCMP826" /LENGTH=128 /DNA_ID=CAMNT_0028410881 /DNA_START=93 /DNA_END=479 /DNA_ORIENTATION=+
MTEEKSDNNSAEAVQRKPLLSPSSFFEPSPDVNYDFVSGSYLLGSVLALVMYLVQRFLFDKIGDGDNDKETNSDVDGGDESSSLETTKELAESLEGIYLIFIPFIPCLLWSLIVRQKWKQQLDLKKES